MTLAAGIRLGPYEILSPLGAGGMGEVYKAKDTRLERMVAVKVLPERLAEDADALARFVREAKAVAALSHPNILAIHDVGHEASVAYAVTELLEGETLREALALGPLSSRKAREYGVQVALGLAAAHEKGIVHRDLKPDNIFITRDERLKILDFGLAKPGAGPSDARDETQSPTVSGYTEPGKVMGTVGYMSPEQVRGVAVDHRSDIFSFGAVLYEMLTGSRAFQRETAAETMTAILKEDPREPSSVGADAVALVPVLRHCLEKKPERRFQSARDLAFALETASVTTTGSGAAMVAPVAERSAVVGKWLGATALIAAAAITGYLVRPARSAAPAPAWSEATVAPLTTDPGYEGEPTFSPDGQTIAYVSDRDGNFEIYLQQIAGGPALNLTNNPAADIQPAVSPDGREIAFVSNRAGGSDIIYAAPFLPLVGGDIWIMPALGGPARRIVQNGNCPSWSPDGANLLYVHGTFRNARIAVVPAAGGESRDVPIEGSSVQRYFFPSLSEDSRWLIYQNGQQIEVVPAAGGKAKVLARGESPAWGVGSTSVVYTNAMPGKGRTLWTSPFSLARGEFSGRPEPLTFGRGGDVGARVSRDGKTIAFSAVDQSLNLEELPYDTEAGRATGPPRELTSGNNRVGFFDPSPDGKAVVFAAERGAQSHLWRIDPPATPVELTRDPKYSDTWPQWSPDGGEIAFSRGTEAPRQGAQAVWLMNADGTNPRKLLDSSEVAAWLPDRKLLVQRGDTVLRVDPATGATAPLAGVKARTLLAVDRSGQWLAYQSSGGGPMNVMAVPVAGGTPRLVSMGTYDGYHPLFSPSGRWLYFQPGHKNLFRVPGPAQGWATAPPQKVTDFTGFDLYIENPRISGDGSKLFYTRGRRTGDIFILHLGGTADAKTAQ